MARYRDKITGRFVSRKTWSRSKGKRYRKDRPRKIIKRRIKRAEFVIHFSYGERTSERGDQRITFQVHVFGPEGASIDDAVKAIRDRNSGKRWPKGWSKKAIFWSKKNGKLRTDPLPSHLRQAAIIAGRVEGRKGR